MHSPRSLCDKLGLTPTAVQHVVFGRLEDCPKRVEFLGDGRNEVARAVAIFALWRIISISGALGIVLTPTQALSSDFMQFMEAVTKRCNPELAEVSGFPRWNVLQIGGRAGWELRVMPNKAPLIVERAPQSVVSVVLEAGNSSPAFVESVKALEEHSTHEKNSLILVW